MSHVQLLAAWQQQNLEEIKTLIEPEIVAEFVYPDGRVTYGDYNKMIQVFEERFATAQEWNFEIIYKAEREEDAIVIMKITREDDHFNRLEKPSLCLFTFHAIGHTHKLKRAHFEMGLTDN
ncbi:hypothetical protein [Macrococcus brunensis]|uniref:hypothetical protein n=1 Tax=Macrococcus brunensis TaxID=198483 RepID=UPI001EF017B2|nr:hypothetical protein [Macrococcus brunensis]ULG73857.1 hypothetical protein MGG13_09370 [Macrococcus brunensis]